MAKVTKAELLGFGHFGLLLTASQKESQVFMKAHFKFKNFQVKNVLFGNIYFLPSLSKMP